MYIQMCVCMYIHIHNIYTYIYEYVYIHIYIARMLSGVATMHVAFYTYSYRKKAFQHTPYMILSWGALVPSYYLCIPGIPMKTMFCRMNAKDQHIYIVRSGVPMVGVCSRAWLSSLKHQP